MPNVKFTDLPNQTTITANTIIPTVSGNVNYTVTAGNLATYAGSNLGAITPTSVSTTGNVNAGNLIGNGAGLTSLTGANIIGTVANASYATSSGSATTATTATNATHATTADNATTATSATSATSATTANYATTAGSATTADSATTATTANTVTNAAQANITSVGTLSSLSVSGNVNGGNLYTVGQVSASGNITGNYILGNGSQLTGMAASYGNANVAAYLPTYTGNLSPSNLSVSGTTTLGPYIESTAGNVNTSTSVTPAMSNGPVQKFIATANFTLNVPTGMTTGQSITMIIRQDATGNRTMSANTSYKFAYGVKTLSTSANAIDSLSIFYDGTNYLCNLVKGYA